MSKRSRVNGRYDRGLLRAALLAGVSAVTLDPAAAQESRTFPGMAVTVSKTQRQCFTDSIQVTGVLAPKEEVQVRPEREGLQVSQLFVEPGDTVVAGQVLARLAPPEGAAGGSVPVPSPVSGTVSAVSATVGSFASASAPQPLFRIVVGGELELQGEISAKAVARLKRDQPASVQVVGVGALEGKVVSIAGGVDPTTQLATVRIALGNDQRLRVGAFARAQINAGQSCGAAIPLSAVLYGADGAVVQVVRGERIETRRVRVGLLSGGVAEIREGLSDSDLVVSRAGSFLRDGDRVRAVVEESATTR
jgi:multidrug efflux pump subunit AcrA (membrane-fusion protein)